MGITLQSALRSTDVVDLEKARSFYDQKKTIIERLFLRRKAPRTHSRQQTLTVGFVARALSEHHFVEEWAEVNDRYISFYSPQKVNPKFRIDVHNIIEVKELESTKLPKYSGFHFLFIETIGRTTYLMFDTEDYRDSFLKCLQELKASASPDTIDNTNSKSFVDMVVDDPMGEFLHKSTMWQTNGRRILNCKEFDFNSLGACSSAVAEQSVHPCTIVEEALVNSFQCKEDGNDEAVRIFLNSATKLKFVNVRTLSENERLAFCLNLYHVMVMHTFLVLGTPDSVYKMGSSFGTVAYQVSDEIFSLTELEHCIIRAGMSRPSQFLFRLLGVFPNSTYSPQIALTICDYRINFALNCGSTSNPDRIPIYRIDTLDVQLDDNARCFIRAKAKIHFSGKTLSIVLPKICQWYVGDFGKGNSTDILRTIEKYFSSEHQKMLQSTYGAKPVPLSVKFLPFNFAFRHLTLS